MTAAPRPLPLDLRAHLLAGQVIPAHPLALDERRRLDERHQRALTRYYVASGAGGIAVGVHTTQFEIREPQHGLLGPVLELASRTADDALAQAPRPFVKIAGVCGRTAQAMHESRLAHDLGYHAGLVSLGAWRDESESMILDHCRVIADILPLFGFYLQPAVGGRVLSYRFWREFAELPNVWAIKIAPFNRYQTIDVVRAVVEAGRDDIALYTGNDDNIVADLLTPFPVHVGGTTVLRWIDGGLLGQWAVWTRGAVSLLAAIKEARASGEYVPSLLSHGAALTDAATKAGFVPQGTIDGRVLPHQVIETFDRGEQAHVPVLAGFNSGELRPTIAGSIAIPSFFRPVHYANHILVDGGVVNPLPLDQASADCDILVGIDVNGDPSDRIAKVDYRALDVWFGSAQIMMHSLTAHMMAAYPPDVYARPHVSSFGAMEFWRVKEIIEAADREKDNFKRHLSHKVEQFIKQTGETTRAGD